MAAAVYTPATPWQGAELTVTNRGTTRVSVGAITGIQTTGVPDQLLLENAYGAANMPLLGSAYPNNPQWICRSIRVVPISAYQCRVYHTHSSTDWGQTLYLIRDSTTLEQVQTQVMPGPDKTPFRIRYTDPDNPGNNIVDTLALGLTKTVRNLDITHISYGQPPTNIRPNVNYVSSATFLGLPLGFWKLTRFESDISVFAGSYQCTSSISTRGSEDWSEYGILRNSQTGRYVDAANGMAAAIALPYSYGIIYPPHTAGSPSGGQPYYISTLESNGSGGGFTAGSAAGSQGNDTGVIRVGPYQTVDLNTLYPGLNAADGGGPAQPFGGGGPFPTGS